MKVLITGGTGFLGRRLVARLSAQHSLRLLVRPSASRERFPAGGDFAPGDVTDPASLVRAVHGCDAVIHAAALVKIMGSPLEYDRINLDGFDNVLTTAMEAGVRKMIYVSSFIALGPSERGPGGVLDETAEPQSPPWINDYARTKALADRRARRAIADGAPLSVVYPGVLYGAGEMTEGNIVIRHVLDLLHRRVPMLIGAPGRRWSYVHVDDVARGTAAVLETSDIGSRYVLG